MMVIIILENSSHIRVHVHGDETGFENVLNVMLDELVRESGHTDSDSPLTASLFA